MNRDEFIASLVEQHRPVIRKAPLKFGDTYMVQCRACDGTDWHPIRRSQPVPMCTTWMQARLFGLISDARLVWPGEQPDLSHPITPITLADPERDDQP